MESTSRLTLLNEVYGSNTASSLAARLDAKVAAHRQTGAGPREWSERDAWLIAYPDHFSRDGESPLATLGSLLAEWNWLTGVHVLPCYPWSSDDGFAVIDYRQIESSYGTWSDVQRLGEGRTLMLDAVINHMSSQSTWFREYLAGRRDAFFAEESPGADYRDVVRPRTTPLFHTFDAHDGPRSVWTTFSADQVDLDYANPAVLEAVADVLLCYCANGATALRLDAIGFMWKQPGTTSIHLPQTHTLIAVLGSVVREAYPGTLIVSEVNVPHAENIAYLGTREHPESDLIYQFTLAPLTLYAVATGDCEPLVRWADDLTMPREGVSFLNFLASHDGVGVRPAEGLVPSMEPLLGAVAAAGGEVSFRDLPGGGGRAPYELNSTWYDLVGGVEQHLATHAVMMAMPGIPLIYAQSLFGSSNDHELFAETHRARSLNRHKFTDPDALIATVADPSVRAGRVFAGIRAMIQRRAAHPAFHPEAAHRVSSPASGVIRIDRRSNDAVATVVVNLTAHRREILDVDLTAVDDAAGSMTALEPWEHRWITSL